MFQMQLHGIEHIAEELKGAVHQGMLNGLEAIGERGSAIVQHNISTPYNGKPAAVATGILVGSVHGDLIQSGNQAKVIIAAHAPADVYNAAVETGTRPHFPPPSALVPWVKLRFHPASEKEALQIAFAISRAIAKRGTKGHFMFQRGLEQLQGEAQGIMEHNIAQAIMATGYKVKEHN
jgi:hypothetical protein